jgi:predicted anti-sigma-YlaC factor YlaD
MANPSPLDDPEAAANAWARYRRLMRWMAWSSLVAVVLGLIGLRLIVGDGLTIHMMIATAVGVGGSVLLGAALMGLVFLSSGSGHDEAIDDPFKDLVDR